MTLLRNLHKSLTIANLAVNTLMFLPGATSFLGIKTQAAGALDAFKKNYLHQNIIKTIDKFHFGTLLNQSEDITNLELFFASGFAGFTELLFSKSIFGQQTHFGLIYPTLVLCDGRRQFSGDPDGKVLAAIVGVFAFECVKWWNEEDHKCDHHDDL